MTTTTIEVYWNEGWAYRVIDAANTANTVVIGVYWNEGWAYRVIDAAGERSGWIDAAPDDLDDAIREACRLEGLDLTPDQFAREPSDNGGWAIYRGPIPPARRIYTIRVGNLSLDNFEARDLADALDQLGAPADVRDVPSFAAWLERGDTSGWIEEDGVQIYPPQPETTKTYTIRTDEGIMDDFEAHDLAGALAQFGAPAGVRDIASFATWLDQVGGYGWIEEDGVRIISVPA